VAPPGDLIRVTLIAHAATPAVRMAAFADDEALAAAGRRSLAAFAPALRLGRADRCLTSPAQAARETAAALCDDATVEPALRECDWGRWRGRTLDDVQAAEPDAVARWLADADAAPHGGESLAALRARVAAWLATLEAGRGTIFAVTHASVLRAAMAVAVQASPAGFWRIDAPPLAQARLRGRGGRWTLAALLPP
jgi:broad specificity phosphatase PhoE